MVGGTHTHTSNDVGWGRLRGGYTFWGAKQTPIIKHMVSIRYLTLVLPRDINEETKDEDDDVANFNAPEIPPIIRSHDISELLVCGYCRELRGPQDVTVETQSYVCPSCCCVVGKLDAKEQDYRCSVCYGCPECSNPTKIKPENGSPNHVLTGQWLMEYPKTHTVPKGIETGRTVFELFCPACQWRSSSATLVATSIAGLFENVSEVSRKMDPTVRCLRSANQFLQSIKIKSVEPPPKLCEIPVNVHTLATNGVLRSPFANALDPQSQSAQQGALCNMAVMNIAKPGTRSTKGSVKDATKTQEKLAKLDCNLIDKVLNVRALNLLVVAHTAQVALNTLPPKTRAKYEIGYPLQNKDVTRMENDAAITRTIKASEIKAGTAKLKTPLDKMSNALTNDACQSLAFPSWSAAHGCLKLKKFPVTADSVVLDRVKLIGRRSRKCIKCERSLTRGFNPQSAEPAARTFIPRILFIRHFAKDDLLKPTQSSPPPSRIDFSDIDALWKRLTSERFPPISKSQGSLVWCILSLQNVRNDEVMLRLLTDQMKSDVPTDEAVTLSDLRATVRSESNSILEATFQFYDPKLRRVEMKGKETANENIKARSLTERLISDVPTAEVAKYIASRTGDDEVTNLMAKFDDKNAFVLYTTDTMTCVALPVGVKESAKAGTSAIMVLPGIIKVGDRQARFAAEIEFGTIIY
eukprot:Blabericola_migrator_1__10920@NODE_630_length_7163_cov_61_195603_g461_i0_p2_GENE_NODE_630_length_7163_cov_61_195603_g461_i0NODE_630_length_7163_cov_61_195603_g461_i0_p2_ORF_typecomplete_len694_score141_54Dynactin_p62/PF05502_13/1_3e18_NODE_630_length_7163_cov_61_195603_g461_i01552236